ncbi:MAG: 3-deoxy-D-manno-octulosonic acid transferase [Saprospiraceae bacterium]|nr:3-deoxy-D-manno-octulosonic acid transferase [Saprospiraceae bacterium]
MVKGQQKTICWLKSFKPEDKTTKVVWMHCASLGEFEQGRMVLEHLKKQQPEWKIYLSFFSPSGYEMRKNWKTADKVFYLPTDTPAHATLLIDTLQPDLFILVKYDFWWNIIRYLEQKKIPVILTAAHFTENKYYLRQPFLSMIKKWKYIFAIQKESVDIALHKGIQKIEAVGDPRIDRVLSIKSHGTELPERLVQIIRSKPKVIIYGSVWMEDIKIIKNVIRDHPEYFHIVVPHDIMPDNIRQIKNEIPVESSVFSKNEESSQCQIFDQIGYLSGLYKYANLVYIGGGFGKGIHNTLEPAVYGIPVMMGPKHQKFVEATENIQAGNAFCVYEADDINNIIHAFEEAAGFRQKVKEGLEAYFDKHKGASEKIVRYIQTQL